MEQTRPPYQKISNGFYICDYAPEKLEIEQPRYQPVHLSVDRSQLLDRLNR